MQCGQDGFIVNEFHNLALAEFSNASRRCTFISQVSFCMWSCTMSSWIVTYSFVSFLSDGIDRTGAFICLYSQLERIKVEGVADVFQFVKASRFHRPELVKNVVSWHYIFGSPLSLCPVYSGTTG